MAFLIGLALFLPLSISTAWSDGVLLLDRPETAAKVRLDLIREAKSEILLSSYIFHQDRVGSELLAALREAARRGVKVKILLDAWPYELSAELISHLSKNGVELHKYNPKSALHPMQSLARLHDKLLIVDQRYLVLGDRNIGNEYFGLANRHRVSKDVYIEGGESAKNAAQYFKGVTGGEKARPILAKNISKDSDARIAKKLDRFSGSKGITQRLKSEENWRARVQQVDKVAFFHDPIGLKGKAPGVESVLLDSIRRAHDRIVIENPYIILTDQFRTALKAASERGVKIEVITNSAASTDSKIVAAAWERSRDFLASIGADVWEHPGQKERPDHKDFRKKLTHLSRGESMIHSKTMVLDDEAIIMSYNLDSRSEKINLEVAQRIENREFADNLVRILEDEKKELGYLHRVAGGRPLMEAQACSLLYRVLARIFERQL